MPFQVLNPMEAMQVGADRARANRLADIQEADIVRARREQDMMNQLYRQAYNPQTGQIDTNRLYGSIINQGMGVAVPKMQAAEADVLAKRATAAKTTAEVPKQIWENARNELSLIDVEKDPNAQERYAGWAARLVSQAPWTAQLLPPKLDKENKERLLTTADKAIEQHFVTQDLGGTTRVLAMPKYGTGAATVVPGSTGTVTASPNRPQTNVITQAESEYGKKVAGQAAEDTNTQFRQTEAAVRGIAQTDRAIDLLEKGQPLTGLGADLELGIRRLQQTVAGRKDKTISDTELLEAVLGQDVFQQIQQLGIGARGLDTPAEREFLRQVVSGTKTLNKDTLLQMAKIKRQAQEDIVNAWNQRTQSGELDDWYKFSKRPKRLFNIPKRESAPGQTALSAQDQQALDWANANPRDPRAAEIKKRLGVK
jgi:hypothetical protein